MADYRDFEELIKDEEGSEPPKTPKKRIAKAALDKKETEKRPSKTPRKQKVGDSIHNLGIVAYSLFRTRLRRPRRRHCYLHPL